MVVMTKLQERALRPHESQQKRGLPGGIEWSMLCSGAGMLYISGGGGSAGGGIV